MRFNPWKCPQCGESASGTLDTIPGLALLQFDDQGDATWQGETKVLWNGQTTDRDTDGRVTLTCPDGHEWQAVMEADSDPPGPDPAGGQ